MSTLMTSIGTLVKNHVADNKGVAKIVDTESNITSRSSDPIGTIAFGTDTDDIYIHTGSGTWVKLVTQAVSS